jgi:small subunit ribosomal protein S17
MEPQSEIAISSGAESEAEKGRGSRRTLRGLVVSDRMEKTITVRVERVFKHPKYKKYIRRHKKYHAHDEERTAHVGDEVEIRECRPLSKIKRWRLVEVVSRAALPDGGDL